MLLVLPFGTQYLPKCSVVIEKHARTQREGGRRFNTVGLGKINQFLTAKLLKKCIDIIKFV